LPIPVDSQFHPEIMHYVYILRCGDDTLYTGYTTDVERRIEEHRRGTGAKYTRGRGPLELAHVEEYETQSTAMTREHEIKQLSRNKKEQIIRP
jgi:putative endonuclease